MTGEEPLHPDRGGPGCPVRVAVVEDHPLYRHALLEELRSEASFAVLGGWGSIEEFHAGNAAAQLPQRSGGPTAQPVVLLDLNLPGLSGPEGVANLHAAGFAVLILSAVDDPPRVLDAIAAGAAGYLTKSAEGQEIVTAVRIIASGRTYISPTLASFLLAAATGQAHSPPGLQPIGHPAAYREHADRPEAANLTERERTILGLVAAGETDRDIARELCVTVSTVRSHLDRIRDKTGRRRRPDLTRLAYEAGIRQESS